ncbi:hypothetical protein [Tsukamurella sp. 1534]|uniref:hypothetical protein n=1 Tax=Tsukamurella sp. 1534 TaxID=1151061 RepID=UPI0005936512|nr:hypothetical protein [Tsukamurella sp. 1534]
MGSENDRSADLGRSAGARAIEARAAIATAQLRTTVTSISSSVGYTSPHGERIVETVEGLVGDVLPELEAAEALQRAHASDDEQPSSGVVWPSPFPGPSSRRAVGVFS